MLKNLKSLTILYVEDDKLTQNLIKKALEHLVKEVYLAKDGMEGLKLYKKISPDIVLTDMYMPNMDGLEMSRKIKELNQKQAIGLFTGDEKEELHQQAQLLNIDVYILKPLNRKQFFDSLTYLATLT